MAAPADTGPERHVTTDAPPEDGPGGRRAGWVGLGVAAASFLCGLMAGSLLGGTYAAARGLEREQATADLGFALCNAAGLWVGILGMPILWSRRKGGPGRALGLCARWVDLPLGLGVGLASTIVTAVVSSIALTTTQQEALEATAEEFIDRAHGPAAVALLVVMLCVLTPLAEEVFFRGLLFGSLRRVVWPLVAVPVAGLIFGLVHYDGGAQAAVVVLVHLGLLSLLGCALCALAHRTGRLGASIVAHAGFNAVTVISLLAQR